MSPSRPGLAAVLSFTVPGLGHLYAGQGRRALLLILLYPLVECVALLMVVFVPVQVANILLPTALALALRTLLANDAARCARGLGGDKPIPGFSRWYACVGALFVIAVVNLMLGRVFRTTLVGAYKMTAGPMTPTIVAGDHLLAVKWAYGWREPVFRKVVWGARQPARGELVIFLFPEDRSRAFIMRLIGLPGELIEIRNRRVLVNGKLLEEPYVHFLIPSAESRPEASPTNNWGPERVPSNSFFVLGDNRDNSRDSRYWGFVKQDDLLGRAAVVYWSAVQGRVRWERIGRRLEAGTWEERAAAPIGVAMGSAVFLALSRQVRSQGH